MALRRNGFTFRDRYYQQAPQFGRIVPVFRRLVYPGTRYSDAMCRLNFQTAALSRVYMNSGVLSMSSFYVPLRLVWPEFPELIAESGDSSFNQPVYVSANAAPWLFDYPQAGASRSSLYRRAVKLCYNQFFGKEDAIQQDGTPAWYNVTDDTFIGQKYGRTLEQRINAALDRADVPDYTFPTTTGTPDTIDLRAFNRRMAEAKTNFRERAYGDKYVDFLRHMGVDPDWRIQMAPELLGTSSMEVFPQYETSSEDATLGRAVTKYYGTLNHAFGNKAFAEHGLIVCIAMFRMHEFVRGFGPLDSQAGATTTRQLYYVGADEAQNQSQAGLGLTGTPNVVVPPGWRIASGQNVIGQVADVLKDYIGDTAEGRFEYLEYPTFNFVGNGDDLGADQYAMLAEWTVKGATPAAMKIVF